jgi:hypothetical protein
MLLTTLFSITNTTAPTKFVEGCFTARVHNTPDVDKTINHFKGSLSRLQQAFIKVVEEKTNLSLSMVNPSVNDYKNSRIISNHPIANLWHKCLNSYATCFVAFSNPVVNPSLNKIVPNHREHLIERFRS